MRFSLRLSTTLSATALAALLTPVGPANADTALLTCTESTTATYSPAIVNTPQGITVNASGTASCTGLPPGYTSATTSDQYTVTLGCTDLLQFPTGTKTYTWNNSATSTFSFTRINNRVVNGTTVVELIGSITAGDLPGRRGQRDRDRTEQPARRLLDDRSLRARLHRSPGHPRPVGTTRFEDSAHTTAPTCGRTAADCRGTGSGTSDTSKETHR